MNRMVIYIGDTDKGAPNNIRGWMVRHEGDCAREVIELFGTDTLPTPFLAHVRASQVRLALETLNPGVDVVVEQDEAIKKHAAERDAIEHEEYLRLGDKYGKEDP